MKCEVNTMAQLGQLSNGKYCTMGIFERNEYIPHGNELVPYEITFMRIGNEFIPILCWNLHKPKPPKIKTFLMEKVS